MPIFKLAGKLVYYAHVPKCAGSAVEAYIGARFGKIAFVDTAHALRPEAERWSKTSPQHIDCASLSRLFPAGFFDASFTVVRHPVHRLVSVYHFQRDHEHLIPADTAFSDWLADLAKSFGVSPFALDNHVRPMDDLVPHDAKVFYLEHDIDSLIPWFDSLAGQEDGPRTISPVNERGAHGSKVLQKAEPSVMDIKQIERLYQKDFLRFGYVPDARLPIAKRPDLGAAFLARRELERQNNAGFINRVVAWARRKLAK